MAHEAEDEEPPDWNEQEDVEDEEPVFPVQRDESPDFPVKRWGVPPAATPAQGYLPILKTLGSVVRGSPEQQRLPSPKPIGRVTSAVTSPKQVTIGQAPRRLVPI